MNPFYIAYRSPMQRSIGIALLSIPFLFALPVALWGQDKDLKRLVHPETAERMGLTDVQRVTLQQLLQQRTDLEATTASPERTSQLNTNADQVLAVLTDEQKALWNADASGKLKFQFRDMEWDGVLDWFARQESLTLVMDRTPPGTFTYSDHRQYTSAEAIDLLNSVLLTRGFTLIRREKMLIVFELSDAIPIELIPRITLEQLPSRGRFELVSILFPLGTRPIEEVVKEVTPYLGKYGRVIPLAQSRQLLVVENAGKMQTINVLIATVPEPKVPAAKPDPPPPPQPVFASYSIAGLDPDATLKAIKTLVPSEQITIDGKTRILSAFVVPSLQAAIAAAIQKMVSEHSTAPPQVAKAFPVAGNDPVALAAQIKALAPQATVAGEKGSTQVLVSASEVDMKRIQEAMQSMGITSSATDKSLRSFPLERKPTDAWLTMVKAVVPQANVWLDAEKKRISFLANDEEIKLITKLVPELMSALPVDQARTLKVYAVTDEQKQRYATVSPTLTDLAGMKLVDSTRPGELLVWGSAEEHLLFTQVLAQLVSGDTNTESELRRYDLNKAELAQFTLLKPEIDKRIAPMQVILDTAGNGLWAWGNAKQHQTLQSALASLRKPGPILKTYSVTEDQKRRFATLTPTLVDLATLKVIDATQVGQLMLWGTVDEHELVGKLLEQLKHGEAEVGSVLRRYEVPKSVLAQLSLLKPEIDKRVAPLQLTIDAATGIVWGWGPEAQHAKLVESLKPLQEPLSVVKQEVVVAYPLSHADPVTLKPVLAEIHKDINVVADAKRKMLMVTGNLEQQTRIQSAIKQLDQPPAVPVQDEMRAYDLRGLQAVYVLPTLQVMWPEMKFTVDAASNRIVATGNARDQQAVKAAIDQLNEPGDGQSMEVKTYAIPFGDVATINTVLLQLAPKAVNSPDVLNRTITVWATEEQHVRIQEAIDQLNNTAQGRQELQSYKVPIDRAAGLKLTLATLFPTAGVSVDVATGQVTVLATKELQTRIGEVIAKSTEPKSEKEMRIPSRYEVPLSLRSAFPSMLIQTFPSATLVTPPTDLTSPLVVLATEDEHARIGAMVEELKKQLDAESASKEGSEIRSYDLRGLQAVYVMPTLQTMWPEMKFTVDAASNRIVASGSERDQQAVKGAIDRLNEPGDGQSMEVKTYAIPFGDVATINTVLLQLAPKSINSPDLLNRTITVWATEEQHSRIQQAIDQLNNTAQGRQELKSYRVPIERAAGLKLSLTTLFPTASVAVDTLTGQVTVLATKEQQAKIGEVITKSTEQKPDSEMRLPSRYEVPPSLRSAFPNMLQQTFPSATLVTPPTDLTSPLVVLATEEEHTRIAAMVEELKLQVETASSLTEGNEMRIFPIDVGITDALSVMNALKAALPTDVLVQSNATTNSVIVTGNVEQLDRAKELVHSLQAQSSAQMKSTKVYPLRFADPTAAARVLTASLPRATVVGDIPTKSVAVTGTGMEHDRVSEFVKAFDVATTSDRETQVYRVGLTNATTLAAAVQLMLPQASVQADAVSGALIVTANPQDQERVKTVVAQLDRRGDSPMVTKSYQLKHSEPTAASRALATSFPKAIFSPDSTNGGLFVTATEVEHAEVAKLVEEMNATSHRKPSLQTYSLQKTSATVVGTALQKALARSTTAAVSFDDASATIFVVGTPEDHAVAKQLTETLDAPDASREQKQLRLFSLSGTDGQSAVTVIKALFENEKPTIDVRYDSLKGQLVVLGSSKQLEAVEKTLAEFTPPERRLEIITLRVNEPSAVRSAIQTLFTDTSFAESPSVNVDEGRQQLLIRATPEQWIEIRKLLGQMGESESSVPMSPATGRVRTMAAPLDADQVLERVQKIWPSLRSNRLEVFKPAPAHETIQDPKVHGPFQPPQETQPNQDASPPVVIIPGDKRWTIASDDPAALAELERLLLANGIQSASPVVSTGNYSLYMLEHAGATNLATILNEVLNKGSSTTSTSVLGKVKIVADPRINALIVYGTRTERIVVEQLLGVLDSDGLNDSLRSLLPQVIAIENTNAKRVLDSVREIYKTQLSSDGGRRAMPIPEGVSVEVANILQQINAASTGPLLTVSLDAMTNSLLVRAPPELSTEVVDFIHLMDRQASEKMTTRIDIIPLQHSNAARIRKALDILIQAK